MNIVFQKLILSSLFPGLKLIWQELPSLLKAVGERIERPVKCIAHIGSLNKTRGKVINFGTVD